MIFFLKNIFIDLNKCLSKTVKLTVKFTRGNEMEASFSFVMENESMSLVPEQHTHPNRNQRVKMVRNVLLKVVAAKSVSPLVSETQKHLDARKCNSILLLY